LRSLKNCDIKKLRRCRNKKRRLHRTSYIWEIFSSR